jgi:hypothetical protein
VGLASHSKLFDFSNGSGLSGVIATERFDFRPKHSTDDRVEENRERGMLRKQLSRNGQILALILERDQIKVIEPRHGSRAAPRIHLPLRDVPGDVDVGGYEMIASYLIAATFPTDLFRSLTSSLPDFFFPRDRSRSDLLNRYRPPIFGAWSLPSQMYHRKSATSDAQTCFFRGQNVTCSFSRSPCHQPAPFPGCGTEEVLRS